MVITNEKPVSPQRERVSDTNSYTVYNLTKSAYSVTEILEILPFGRTYLYSQINCGNLKARKLGKKTIFLASDVAAFLASLQPSITGEAANGK